MCEGFFCPLVFLCTMCKAVLMKVIKEYQGAREMAQWLKELALVEDASLTLSTHMVPRSHL